MREIYILLSLLCTTLLWGQQPLTQVQANAFKEKVVQKNKTIKTMQASFVQKKHLEFMSKDMETKGEMAFSKPDKLNWSYTTPYSYRIVFQGDNIKVDDAVKVSQMKADNKVFKKINQLITRSVSGDMFDQKEFAVTFFTSGKETLTKLLPKDKTLLKYIKEIHLFFSPDATVGRVKLIEPTDDYTEITFTHQQFNTPIDEATFKL